MPINFKSLDKATREGPSIPILWISKLKHRLSDLLKYT